MYRFILQDLTRKIFHHEDTKDKTKSELIIVSPRQQSTIKLQRHSAHMIITNICLSLGLSESLCHQ